MAEQPKPDYVTITYGMRGYFAVHLAHDPECGFHTPWQSGFGSFETPQEAEPEARAWAQAEEIEFVAPDYERMIASVQRSNRRSEIIFRLRREADLDLRDAYRTSFVILFAEELAQTFA